MKSKIIVILGPTASGKSELAIRIARRFNGEIISADSRQVYKELDIGSGKITAKEMRGIPHHLLDIASPKRTFTVSQYQKLAQKAIKQILKRGKIPIICGGTGLYIDSLVYETKFPKVLPQPKLRQKLEKLSTEKLFEKLSKLDPRRSQNIDAKNRRRLIRALEIVITTGRPVPQLMTINIRVNPRLPRQRRGENPRESAPAYTVLKIGIKKSPEELKKRIKKRLLKRLKIGMIEEVENLRKQRLSWKRLDNLGLEYRFISRYLRGLASEAPRLYSRGFSSHASSGETLRSVYSFALRATEDTLIHPRLYRRGFLRFAEEGKKEMKDLIVKESVKYAKRQMTWFKRDKKIHWIEKEGDAFNLIKEFK